MLIPKLSLSFLRLNNPFTSALSPSSSSELTICAHFLHFFPNGLGEVCSPTAGTVGEGRREEGVSVWGLPQEGCLP